LLVSDVEELKADKKVPATGLVIEAHQEKGRGPTAIALVEQGTLKIGDFVVIGGTYAKIRNLETTTGQAIKEAGPSTPIIMTGLKSLPDFGDEFQVVKNEKQAREGSAETTRLRRAGGGSAATSGSELLRIISRSNKLTEFNIIVKADVQGSLTSVIDSLKTLDTDEVAVRIVSSGVGVINESDIHTAATAGAIIYGFHVSLPPHIKQLAARDKVQVRLYTIIYELIDDVKKELETHLAPEIVENELGILQVKGIFKISKTEVICGGQVTKGTLRAPALARVLRDKELIADNLEVTKLQRGPTEVSEVPEGEMCGLSFRSESRVEVQENDRIELFTRQTKTRTL
jgi:translation initiation factor IF-2